MFRQGDVLIQEVAAIPSDAKEMEREGGRIILARGEVTGHHHAISDMGAVLFAFDGNATPVNGRLGNVVMGGGSSLIPDRFLKVKDAPVRVYHEEHDPIELPAGNWKVTIQREYAPDDVRNVAD
jgi:hypothetical protein